MLTIIKRELKANSKSLFFWVLGVLIMGLISFYEYEGVVNAGESMEAMLQMMPRILRVMFGISDLPVDSFEWYYACIYIWFGLIVYSHAIFMGANIVSKEESDNTADFLYTMPIKRNKIVNSKIIASLINISVINFAVWFSYYLLIVAKVNDLTLLSIVNKTIIGMLITQILFFFIGLLISMISNNKKISLIATVFLLVNYFGGVFIEILKLDSIFNILSLFRYFDPVLVITNGIDILFIILSILIAITSYIVSIRKFNKKEFTN